MTIDLRFWNLTSERIWRVKHVNFDHFDFFVLFSVFTSDVDPYAQNPFFLMALFLLDVPFWMTINLRFLNPTSERIWWVKHVNFDHFDFFTLFSVLTSDVDLSAQKSFFSWLFFFLKVPFWMTINLRFWNPTSEHIWWVKHVNFDQFYFFALFSLFTSDVDLYAQKPFFSGTYFF